MKKKIDCSICFITTHFPPGEMEDFCKLCKETNGLFYDPPSTESKGYVAVVLKDMQMPKNCAECRFGVYKSYYDECYFTGKPLTSTKRQCKCPLKEIKDGTN